MTICESSGTSNNFLMHIFYRLFHVFHLQVLLNQKIYHWNPNLVPLAVYAVHLNRRESPRQQLLSKKKQVIQVVLICILINSNNIKQITCIINIYRTIICTKIIPHNIIINTHIRIIIIPIIMICITQTQIPITFNTPKTIKFLIEVFLLLQVQAVVPVAWA